MNATYGATLDNNASKSSLSIVDRVHASIHLPALDGLRGLAILAVLVFHYAGSLTQRVHGSAAGLFASFVGFGWTGVDLFFVLSGFLITGILYDGRNKLDYYRSFYIRRALRIFPAFYLLMAIYLGLTPFLHLHWELGHLFFLVYLGYPAALIWQSLQVVSPFIVVVHLWSLCAEEQFYLVWPWIIAKAWNKRVILQVCAALGLCAILLRVAIVSTHRLDPSWAYGFLPCRMDALSLGAALAILGRSSWYPRLQRWATPGFVMAAGSVVLICAVRHSVDMYDPLIATAGYTITAIAYGALLLSCLKDSSWSGYLFSSKLLGIFGRYSYGLYLYHLPLAPILHPLKDILIVRTKSFIAGSAIYLVAAITINLIVAGLSFHFFESPILRLKTRFLSRPSNAVPEPSPQPSLSAV
jgi:peptidoglycan/LPS O-acetylase OafA/YrhL